MMSLDQFYMRMLPTVEEQLQQVIGINNQSNFEELHHMLAYHMGWQGDGAGPEARGKRIRPLLLLLCAAAAGGDWLKAIPGAVSVELIHNFSLIHDDIQDQSLTRHGRATVWSIWGIAQAINAGDALFSLAQLSLVKLSKTVSHNAALAAIEDLNKTCLLLTQGQFLDLAYEQHQGLSIMDYWPMVAGKTAALLSSCAYIGAVAAQADPQICQAYRNFGERLGLAFQVKDDLLGIWGDAAYTGKSTVSDLVAGKKSLPVLFGLEKNGSFAQRWKKGNIGVDEVSELADQLKAEGALRYVEEQANDLTQKALQTLQDARPQGEAGDALCKLAENLLTRIN